MMLEKGLEEGREEGCSSLFFFFFVLDECENRASSRPRESSFFRVSESCRGGLINGGRSIRIDKGIVGRAIDNLRI